MLELSLHILDLIENATRAGATIVQITVLEDAGLDSLTLIVEDNGPGLPVAPEKVLDPFFTTKEGKHTGLGLSLLRAAAEQAGGRLELSSSETLGGVAVRAMMQLSHVDRAPLGDLPATIIGIILTHPEVNLWCRVGTPSNTLYLKSYDIVHELHAEYPNDFAVARYFSQRLQEALQSLRA